MFCHTHGSYLFLDQESRPIMKLVTNCSFLLLLLFPFITLGKKNLLSFGGNGMIGSAVLDRLIKTDAYYVTMVSRGSWHYDSNLRIKVTRFSSYYIDCSLSNFSKGTDYSHLSFVLEPNTMNSSSLLKHKRWQLKKGEIIILLASQ